ncbi:MULTISPECIES: hypothetical protein [unclassified Helicobacter]|uniref:hypothetical protein n=1 Tax=unclassified Helicobacter TaxID=2593540 RepID=UPI000CF1B22A|nr:MULTISPECIES: hypothetical protein [unclassified Helicobacter]
MKLQINIENCYGIGKIDKELDFTKNNIYVIYAQNGVFKTSFANTVNDLLKKNQPEDRILKHRKSSATISIDTEPISRENTIVFDSYNNKLDSYKKISTFLASKSLKDEYDKVFTKLDKKKKELFSAIYKKTNSKDCEKEFIEVFNNKNIYQILDENMDAIQSQSDLYTFKYHDVFDDDGEVKKFINNNKGLIEEYLEKYNALLSQSDIFSTTENGPFGTHQVKELQNVLQDDRFFKAKHCLEIKGKKVKSSDELGILIANAIDKVINDPNLKATFEKIEKQIKNKTLKAFKEILIKNNSIITKLTDYEGFKKEVMFSYMKQHLSLVENIVEMFRNDKNKILDILERAKNEYSTWEEIIDTFNARFYVPFKVELKNKEDVLLKQQVASLDFIFDDGEQTRTKREELEDCLSNGEKRALYIMQILFEIKAREALKTKQLLIFDDISDSFDYRNKHAIIEYLRDLEKNEDFKFIVMTHNFDFYRTLKNRTDKSRPMLVTKDKERKIIFQHGGYVKSYINSIKNDEIGLIMMIPFARNIIEYTKGKEDENYNFLTSFLHIKDKTKELILDDAIKIVEQIFTSRKYSEVDSKKGFLDCLYSNADKIKITDDPMKLEIKVMLAIACRLKAEEFMFKKVAVDIAFDENQTIKLFDQVKGLLSSNEKQIMQKVLMITPENIHINSFMYEPILDIPLDHLIKCWDEVKGLCNAFSF